MKLILTVPPYAQFQGVVKDPAVEAVRLNTTITLKDSLEDVLARVKAQATPKDVWVDLKCRQLRIADYTVEILNNGEMHYITLSHKINVDTPTKMYIDDGNFIGKILEVDKGDTLVVPSSVERKEGLPLAQPGEVGVRPGMSINILDPSLKIYGYLTNKDKQYIKASKKLGLHNYMLSYVEQEKDITDVLRLDPDAKIIAKIESKKGFEFVKDVYPKYKDKVKLMAARGDMYMELDDLDQIIDGCEQIIKADPDAILASRIFESLKDVDKMPKSQDLFDVYCGMLMGYKRFMVGDDVCMRKDSVESAIGLFSVIAKKYEGYHKDEHT